MATESIYSWWEFYTLKERFEVPDEKVLKVAKALSSDTRLAIISLLINKSMDVSRIAEALKQTEANISAQVKLLEQAGLIKSHYEPGEHGVRKVCEPAVKNVIFDTTSLKLETHTRK
ncbi:MAG: ArsR/SmtB family transcription factor [Promethearchaeota archaeon]